MAARRKTRESPSGVCKNTPNRLSIWWKWLTSSRIPTSKHSDGRTLTARHRQHDLVKKNVSQGEKNGVKINQVGVKAQSYVIVTVLSTRLNTSVVLPNQKLSDLLSVYRRVIVLVGLLRHQGFTKQASGGTIVCVDILLCYYSLMKKSLHLIWCCK